MKLKMFAQLNFPRAQETSQHSKACFEMSIFLLASLAVATFSSAQILSILSPLFLPLKR